MYKAVSKETLAKASCKYELTTAISKRARMLVDREQCTEDFKPVLQALEELEDNKLVIVKE